MPLAIMPYAWCAGRWSRQLGFQGGIIDEMSDVDMVVVMLRLDCGKVAHPFPCHGDGHTHEHFNLLLLQRPLLHSFGGAHNLLDNKLHGLLSHLLPCWTNDNMLQATLMYFAGMSCSTAGPCMCRGGAAPSV